MARMRTQMTPQMSRVLEILKTERVHLNAEEILQQVDVSRPTVYRALDRLMQEGFVRRLSLEGDRSVYEYVREVHAHFVCRNCGKIYDLPFSKDIGTELIGGSGHQMEKTDVTVYGTCRNCLKDNKKQEEIL